MRKLLIAAVIALVWANTALAQTTEVFAVNIPLPAFTCDGGTSSIQANQVLYLENYLPAASLPNPAYIAAALFWDQGPGNLPSGSYGDISVGIDPGLQYVKQSGFPATQTSIPQFTKTLISWEPFPNGSHQAWKTHNPPLAYRAGSDGIIFAPECAGNFAVAAGSTLEVFVIGPPIGPGQVFSTTLDSSINAPNLAIRNIIPNISAGGTQIRVHVSSLWMSVGASHLSAGVQASGANTVATPVELTFGGASGFSLPIYSGAWSDWVSLSTSAAQNLLIDVDQFGGTGNWAYRGINSTSAYYSTTASWNSATMLGTVTPIANRSYIIDQVQIQ